MCEFIVKVQNLEFDVYKSTVKDSVNQIIVSHIVKARENSTLKVNHEAAI